MCALRPTFKPVLLPPEASSHVSLERILVLLWMEDYLPNGRLLALRRG
jgi:hypothetical protein